MEEGLLDRIFAGSLERLPPLGSKIVRIFTSSTFTDMSLERNTLMEEVYPRLKEYCRDKHGLEFQVVDMRWGVRDEATDDHMTTELCMKEIKNCQRLSMGPNFVVFLGQKYGYRPIPTCIDGSEFLKIRGILVQLGVDISLLILWYKEDTNAVPSVYVLQPISSILHNFNNKHIPKLQAKDQATWWDTLGKLQQTLRRAAQSLFAYQQMDKEAMHNYMMSVTEREVINGILSANNTRSTCLAYVRQIENVNMTYVREVSKFIDMMGRNVDIEAQNLLSDLRDNRLSTKIRKPNYIKFTVDWDGKEGLNSVAHHDYLVQFTQHFYKYIKKLVDKAMQRAYLTQQSPVVTEMLQHLHMCNEVVKVFQGRTKELKLIQDYIQGNVNRPLVLHGVGGCGKTSLLAKAASLVTSWFKVKPVLVLRFSGTTPDSSMLLPMLATVCQQIGYNYNLPCNEVPEDLMPLVAYLKRLLNNTAEDHPLCIFIDSLDQLSGSNVAGKVTWIPLILPPFVKLVITADSDEDSLTFPILRKMFEEDNLFIEVKPLNHELAQRVLKKWLEDNHRTLTDQQWKLVKSAIFKCNLPIFVKLVYAEVCRWKSYTPHKDIHLAFTVMQSIMNFIERVEIQHGRTLVAHAFAYITASKCGISEIELEDLISLDDTVLEDVYQYHLPPVRRIPPLLWTRIRNDIPSYLSEREADGITVLNWYHRQFKEAARERYLKNLNSMCFFHSSIADYFLGTWGGGKPKPFKYTEIQRQRFGLVNTEGAADRKVPLQPLVFSSSIESVNKSTVRYNLRKLNELPFHLVKAHRYIDLFNEVLFNYNWLVAKLSSCPLSAVLADFEDAKENIKDRDKDAHRELTLMSDSLRLGRAVLSEYPHMVGPQITGRLLPVKNSYKNIKSLIDQCDDVGTQYCALVPVYHCLHTPGGPMKYSLEGHPFAVFGYCVTSDSRYILSVSNRFIICDLATSDVTQDIDPDIEGIMLDVQRTSDDKFAITYTNYNLILLLNFLTGDVKKISLDKKEEEGFLCGIGVTNSLFVAWSRREWFFYSISSGNLIEKHTMWEKDYSVLAIYLKSSSVYDMTIKTAQGENCEEILRTVKNGKIVCDLMINGGLALNLERDKAYVTEKIDGTCDLKITLYNRKDDAWCFEKTIVNKVRRVLSLNLDEKEELLMGVLVTKFMIWYIANGKGVSYQLPDTVRNISIQPLRSQSSVIVTSHNQFVVGAVRKFLYVWSMTNGKLLRVLDAHFGRIIRMRTLVMEDFSGFITSSIDRSVKVWNVKNLFEHSHVIDRMDMSVESISIDKSGKLAITVTRSNIGLWNVTTGKMMIRMADSPVGAIITHALITSDGKHIICIESGVFLIWNVSQRAVIARDVHRNVKQLSLMKRDTRVLILSQDIYEEAKLSCRNIPSGSTAFSITFAVFILKPPILTANGQFIVIPSIDKGEECLMMHHPRNGSYLYKCPISRDDVKSFSTLIPLPSAAPLVGLLEGEKAFVFDVSSKRMIRIIHRWHGAYTKNGKYGLYAPCGGGLEVVELRHGRTVRVLLPPVAEGLFSVRAFFSTTNKYVIYHHGGRNTIRLFRVSDGKMIANYKLAAEIHAIESTPDGMSLAVGGVDGTLTLLAIVDPDDPESKLRLMEFPSRAEVGQAVDNVSVTFKSVARHVIRVTKSDPEVDRAQGKILGGKSN